MYSTIKIEEPRFFVLKLQQKNKVFVKYTSPTEMEHLVTCIIQCESFCYMKGFWERTKAHF